MAIAGREQIARWVEAARRGDRAAFGELVRQFQDAAAGVVVARVGPGPDVEDITQEAFVAAYRQLGELRAPAKFGAWICAIARNLALRWLRDRRGHQAAELPAGLAAPPRREPPDLADRVMAAVRRLPDRLRESLTLFYIDGYSTPEVADLLEIPAGTVRRRLHEARNHLRQYMETTMEDEIKRSAPQPRFSEAVLDRIRDIRVMAWGTDGTGRVVILTDDAGRSFPMVISTREAEMMQEALGQTPPASQPSLYDLVLAAAHRFDVALSGARISELRGRAFVAEVDVRTPGGTVSLDARPSDAINLAVRAGIDVKVAREVTRQACPDFDDPRPVEEVIAAAAGGVPECLDAIRLKVRSNRKDVHSRIALGSLLARINIHASYKWPMPMSAEQMARRCAENLAEARTLLTDALCEARTPEEHRKAALWLATAAYLEADWEATAATFDQLGGNWVEFDWPVAFHCATALHRLGRDDEALARFADALKAIDRMHGTETATPPRLVARATLAGVANRSLGGLVGEGRYRELFGAIDPPCLVFGWTCGPPFEYGPAQLLTDRPLTIGSGPDADIHIRDPQCEPLHARVYPTEAGWMVEDLGSASGTWLAPPDERLRQPLRMSSTTRIWFGERRGRGASNSPVFFDLGEVLALPAKEGHAWFVDIAGHHPWYRPVPLAECFRRARPPRRTKVVGKSEAPPASDQLAEGVEREFSCGTEAPDCPGFPAPWCALRVAAAGEGDDATLTLTGPDGRELVLTGPPQRLEAVRRNLGGAESPRPMTEQLAAGFLNAAGLVCRQIVIGPPGGGERIARLHVAGGDRSAWLDAHPIDAVAVALCLDPVPAVWVCDPT